MPLPAFLLASAAFHALPLPTALPGDPYEAIAVALAAEHGLSASPSDVFLIDPPPPWFKPWRRSRAWALAEVPQHPADVHLLHVHLTPEGQLLSVDQVFNLTRTTAANEANLRAARSLAAWSVGSDDLVYSLHLADARHGPDVSGFDPRERWQLRLGWLQETGQLEGVLFRHFKLDPPPKKLWLEVNADAVELLADGRAATVPRGAPPSEGGRYLAEKAEHISRPGNLVTWAVDRVRGFSWFGDDRMQWLKAVAYRVLDEARVRFGLFQGEDSFQDEMVVAAPSEPAVVDAAQRATDLQPPVEPRGADSADANEPLQQWPPPPLAPRLEPPLAGEGEWQSVERDPFVRAMPDGSSAVYTTFIRTDKERQFSRIMITLWDSRVTELFMQSGTEEPQTATGEHGSGLIPREPGVMERLLLAFNGGFQGTHGNFGMMVDKTLYVPPKPFAATVARLDDGATGFGTWPRSTDIPESILSFRQNLTPLIIDEELNPYGRVFWGGAPEGWEDRTRTVRSGLCLTRRSHIAYLYGASVDHQALGRAMQLLDCEYGLHLDMNQGHTGLEFYTVAPEAELKTLGLPLDSMWQAEASVDEMPGYRFRGRRLFKSMQLMNFPRYIRREARDFFYVTRQHLLPGNALQNTSDERFPWTHASLVPEAFPFALMRATFVPDPAARPDTKLHALKLDPKRLDIHASNVESENRPALLSWPQPSSTGNAHLVLRQQTLTIDSKTPEAKALVLASGTLQPEHGIRAALGIENKSGFLVYLEVSTAPDLAQDGKLLQTVLEASGCSRSILLKNPLDLGIAATTALSGHPIDTTATRLFVYKRSPAGARRIFTETPIVDRAVWHPLQRRDTAGTSPGK